MAGRGPRSAIERAEIGNSRPTVVRACALLDHFATEPSTLPGCVCPLGSRWFNRDKVAFNTPKG
jgi:hypothetical protein